MTENLASVPESRYFLCTKRVLYSVVERANRCDYDTRHRRWTEAPRLVFSRANDAPRAIANFIRPWIRHLSALERPTLSSESHRGSGEWVGLTLAGPRTESTVELRIEGHGGVRGSRVGTRGPLARCSGPAEQRRGARRGQRHIPRWNGWQWRWKAQTQSLTTLRSVLILSARFAPLVLARSRSFSLVTRLGLSLREYARPVLGLTAFDPPFVDCGRRGEMRHGRFACPALYGAPWKGVCSRVRAWGRLFRRRA